jgi:Tfp pilus assembly PilM family ATPase
MNQLGERIIKFFSNQPKLFTGFYISSHYICGIHFSPKEKGIMNTYIRTLPRNVVQPSLNERNIIGKEVLSEEFLKAVSKLKVECKDIALVFPEMSQKTFTFSFDSLPGSPHEMEQIIRFRIKKKMPFLPEDAKISYDLISKDSKMRVIAILARIYIIKEYEEFFRQFGFNVRTIVPPSVGLMNLLDDGSRKNCFLLNVEQDSFSLSVFKDFEFILYRQKNFNFGDSGAGGIQDKVEDVFQEVENTLNFIEEGEGKKEMRFWIRSGIDDSHEFLDSADKRFNFRFSPIGSCLDLDLSSKVDEKLMPIMGILL